MDIPPKDFKYSDHIHPDLLIDNKLYQSVMSFYGKQGLFGV